MDLYFFCTTNGLSPLCLSEELTVEEPHGRCKQQGFNMKYTEKMSAIGTGGNREKDCVGRFSVQVEAQKQMYRKSKFYTEKTHK